MGRSGGLGIGNVEDVELTAGGGLDRRVAGRVVRYVVAVYDVL